uniref:Uncharacterized protein n=1 Tax=Arundo donax TaxID=35708 RepID=A0A0A9BBF3_ARUDO
MSIRNSYWLIVNFMQDLSMLHLFTILLGLHLSSRFMSNATNRIITSTWLMMSCQDI